MLQINQLQMTDQEREDRINNKLLKRLLDAANIIDHAEQEKHQ